MFGDPPLSGQVYFVADQYDGLVDPVHVPQCPDTVQGLIVGGSIRDREDHHIGIDGQIFSLEVWMLGEDTTIQQ